MKPPGTRGTASDGSPERAAIAQELRELGCDPDKVMGRWTGVSTDRQEDGVTVDDGALVLPAELAPAVDAFMAASTQWRWIANGWDAPRRVGLDYAGLHAAMALAGIAATPELFGQVRIMEREALRALAE